MTSRRCTVSIITIPSCPTASASCTRLCSSLSGLAICSPCSTSTSLTPERPGAIHGMLTEQDLVVAYSGSGTVSRLEGALRGPMSTMLPPEERTIRHRLGSGRRRPRSVRARRKADHREALLTCHDGSNPHIPNLFGFDNIKKVTESDTGAENLDAGPRCRTFICLAYPSSSSS